MNNPNELSSGFLLEVVLFLGKFNLSVLSFVQPLRERRAIFRNETRRIESQNRTLKTYYYKNMRANEQNWQQKSVASYKINVLQSEVVFKSFRQKIDWNS